MRAAPGDRSRRDDDRYLFLESLLSARRCLYLSYVGRDIRDHSVIPPSVLVSELLDTITRGFYPMDQPGGDVEPQVVTHHPLQAFSRRYFTGDTNLFSYAADLCEASRVAGRTEIQPAPLVTVGLAEPGEEWRTVEVRRLLAFFRHPTRSFVQQRLGIFLEEDEGALETVTDSVDLQGPGRDAVTVSGNDASRIFDVNATTAGDRSPHRRADPHQGHDHRRRRHHPQRGRGPDRRGQHHLGQHRRRGRRVVLPERLAGPAPQHRLGQPGRIRRRPVRRRERHDLVEGSTVSGNTSGNVGGGLSLGGANLTATVRNTTISGNAAIDGGGGVWASKLGGDREQHDHRQQRGP